jgi:group I intron endonuclease
MAELANSGIYEIVNLVNGKKYIGSAKSLHSRFGNHRVRLVSGKHHNRYLQKSWIKYGAEAFAFRVLLICRPTDLICFEQRAIDSLRPEYNLSPTAGSTLLRLGQKRSA